MLRFCLLCVASWAAPWGVLGQEQEGTLSDEEGTPHAQGILENQVALWLLSLVGFYVLVRLLDDKTWEKQIPEGHKEAEVVDCDVCPAHTPYLPRYGCAMKCTLRSLEQMEQDIVTLLYKVHKYKMAASASFLPENEGLRTAQEGVPNGLVIYTIQEED